MGHQVCEVLEALWSTSAARQQQLNKATEACMAVYHFRQLLETLQPMQLSNVFQPSPLVKDQEQLLRQLLQPTAPIWVRMWCNGEAVTVQSLLRRSATRAQSELTVRDMASLVAQPSAAARLEWMQWYASPILSQCIVDAGRVLPLLASLYKHVKFLGNCSVQLQVSRDAPTAAAKSTVVPLPAVVVMPAQPQFTIMRVLATLHCNVMQIADGTTAVFQPRPQLFTNCGVALFFGGFRRRRPLYIELHKPGIDFMSTESLNLDAFHCNKLGERYYNHNVKVLSAFGDGPRLVVKVLLTKHVTELLLFEVRCRVGDVDVVATTPAVALYKQPTTLLITFPQPHGLATWGGDETRNVMQKMQQVTGNLLRGIVTTKVTSDRHVRVTFRSYTQCKRAFEAHHCTNGLHGVQCHFFKTGLLPCGVYMQKRQREEEHPVFIRRTRRRRCSTEDE